MNQDAWIINKAAQVTGLPVDSATLAKINGHAIEPLTEEEVFAFRVVMCDNEVDRDFEVFPLPTIQAMAGMFLGKTVIADHEAKSRNQCARIYDTEVVSGSQQASTGEPFSQLVAHCYMLKTSANESLIADILGGIKKEVSIRCRVGAAICSICGTDNAKTWCDHYPGKEYEGKTCHFRLEQAKDAYEVSFVAIPAQPNAGVVKSYGAEPPAGTEQPHDEAVPADNGLDLEIELAAADLFIYENTKEDQTDE